MRRLLSLAAALTLIASPASAGIRDDYRQQQTNYAEYLRRRCEEIKAKATHFTEKVPDLGSNFYVVSGNNIDLCATYNTPFMGMNSYTLGKTYRLNPQKNLEFQLENGELVQYIQHRGTATLVERRTNIKRMRR